MNSIDYVEFTSFLVKNLVHEPDMVSVKLFVDDTEQVMIQVLVKESDMAVLIGRSGKTANAIRTLVQAASYLGDKKRIRIHFDSF